MAFTNVLTTSLGRYKPPRTYRRMATAIAESGPTSRAMLKKEGLPPMVLVNPELCKGLSFTAQERTAENLRGYLPAAVRTPELEIQAVMENLKMLGDNDLAKFVYLRQLMDYNTKLFYLAMEAHTDELMPLVYTPVVGAGCTNYSLIYQRPRGMYLSMDDRGRLKSIFQNWHQPNVKAIVVTDGERILGLGDLGANGMGIPVGKLALYSALGGVNPAESLPVTLDLGTNNVALRDDPLYIGLRRARITGVEYDAFLDEFMEAVVARYGTNCLIQFEDFGNKNAFRLLEKYKEKYCTFNDDIQGTAAVTVAGILTSLRLTKKKLQEQVFLFQGAGEAALGTSHLLVMALMDEGLSETEAHKKIWLIDSKGLVVRDRLKELTDEKKPFAQDHLPNKHLLDIINDIQPTVLIGLSAQRGTFTKEVLGAMAEINERPIIFALSNPTSKAECTAEEAYKHTEGKAIFASGSPFGPVSMNGKTYVPGQGNNSYIFPWVALAVIGVKARTIPERVFLESARLLDEAIDSEDLDKGRVFPALNRIRPLSTMLAAKLAAILYQMGVADLPEPSDLVQYFRSFQWSPNN